MRTTFSIDDIVCCCVCKNLYQIIHYRNIRILIFNAASYKNMNTAVSKVTVWIWRSSTINGPLTFYFNFLCKHLTLNLPSIMVWNFAINDEEMYTNWPLSLVNSCKTKMSFTENQLQVVKQSYSDWNKVIFWLEAYWFVTQFIFNPYSNIIFHLYLFLNDIILIPVNDCLYMAHYFFQILVFQGNFQTSN